MYAFHHPQNVYLPLKITLPVCRNLRRLGLYPEILHEEYIYNKSRRTALCNSSHFVVSCLKVLKKSSVTLCFWSRGSSVSIVTDYDVRFPTGAKDFSSSLCVQTGSGAHPPSYQMDNGRPFYGGRGGVKRPGHEADHSIYCRDEKILLELYLHNSTRLHGVVNTRATLPNLTGCF
jgi:hypothetical protein